MCVRASPCVRAGPCVRVRASPCILPGLFVAAITNTCFCSARVCVCACEPVCVCACEPVYLTWSVCSGHHKHLFLFGPCVCVRAGPCVCVCVRARVCVRASPCILPGLFVAAITNTCLRSSRPSISVSSWLTTRTLAPPWG